MRARLAVLALAASLLSCGGGDYTDVSIARPAVLRTDLQFAYFGAYDNQAADTRGYVNQFWEGHFQGDDKALSNILTARVFTVLMCGDQVYEQFKATGQNYRVRADAAARLRAYFKFLQAGGALGYVKRLVPFDEPNTNVTPGDFRKGILLMQGVAAEFPELAGVGFSAIYAYKPLQYEAIELLADAGIDDYAQKSELLVNGSYRQLRDRLRPDQHTILVVGAAFGETIAPWLNFAESNNEVGSIVAFVWFKAPAAKDVNAIPGHPWVGVGESGNWLRDQYLNAGRTVITGQ